ncbi:pilus assembly protein TadG-related protein [Marisediminicola senii]|uniref:pilus assembly protein TadG-related protein n=1 Tax=Marisediminicola senii TaxID=2711233 RepID=UPI0013EA2B53|nr:pilus assembly protein TadG-related protein [Marisediminicola senii]
MSGQVGPTERAARDDTGSTLVLTIFYGFLSLALILLVIAATSLYLERKRLFTLADGAALVGAEAFDLDDVTVTETGVRAELDSVDVAAAVGSYIDAAAAGDFDSLVIERAESPDGRSATVQLSSYWRPPVLGIIAPEGVRVEVTAVARAVIG